MRTILVHINVEVPDDSAATADGIASEIAGCIEVGREGDHCPDLAAATEIVIPLAEEV